MGLTPTLLDRFELVLLVQPSVTKRWIIGLYKKKDFSLKYPCAKYFETENERLPGVIIIFYLQPRHRITKKYNNDGAAVLHGSGWVFGSFRRLIVTATYVLSCAFDSPRHEK